MKMKEHKAVALCSALGIRESITKQWLNAPAQKAADNDDMPRFNLEGPIIGSDAEMYFDELVGYVTPASLREFLADNKGKDIEVNINSPGGSVYDAQAMVSDLMRHDGAIRIVVSGACFSAATDFLTIERAHRIAMPGSMFMIHNAWTIAVGDSNEFMKVAERLEKSNNSYADRLANTTGYDKETLKQMMDDETWFDDKEAYEGGLVDELYGMDDEEEEDSMKESSDDAMSADLTPDEAIIRGQKAVDARLVALL